MRSLAELLTVYNHFHQKKITKIIHFIGVPLILFSLLVILGWVHVRVPNVFDMPLAWLLTIAVVIYYLFLDLLIGASLGFVFILLNVIATLSSDNSPSWLSLQLFLYPFIIGWILQLVGHFFEKKKPAFSQGLWQIIIAPAYLMAQLFFYFGYKQKLQQRITDLTELKS